MGRSKKLKNLRLIFKDKAKIIKAKLSTTNSTTNSIQIAVLRATTRSTHSPPPDHSISALVSLSHTTRHSTSACVSAIIDRLHHHHGQNVYVTLKSLITLHSIFTRASFFLKERLVALNLSRFIDSTDMQSREFSFWAQWYASFLESNLSTSAILGCSLSSSKFEIEKKKKNIKSSLYMDLFKEIESLVSTIEVICKAPESLHCQKNDIVYEVMRLVGEDYRMAQHHTMIRLTELSERVECFTNNELSELTQCLERLEGCKDRLTELFVNRKRNDAFWDLVRELMVKLMRVKEDREMKSATWKMIEYATESTRVKNQFRAASRRLGLLPLPTIDNNSLPNTSYNFHRTMFSKEQLFSKEKSIIGYSLTEST